MNLRKCNPLQFGGNLFSVRNCLRCSAWGAHNCVILFLQFEALKAKFYNIHVGCWDERRLVSLLMTTMNNLCVYLSF